MNDEEFGKLKDRIYSGLKTKVAKAQKTHKEQVMFWIGFITGLCDFGIITFTQYKDLDGFIGYQDYWRSR